MKRIFAFFLAAAMLSATLTALPPQASAQDSRFTVYTSEMRQNARRNIEKYDWAKKLRDDAVKKADEYAENLDALYMHIPGEGIPRSYTIATLSSPADMTYICPYCKDNIQKSHGGYSWMADAVSDPWKIQCPSCLRKFPSNDFESFYRLGRLPDGTFDRELATRKNAELVAKGEPGYLVNILYPNVAEELGIPEEDVSTWLVDDGFGWSPADGTYGTDSLPKYAPIAYYAHKIWGVNGASNSIITNAVIALRDAYLYTGDEKYGVAGTILLDRIADVYPGFDITKVSLNYANSHGGRYTGKTVGAIWESGVVNHFIRAYDAFRPMLSHPKVIEYLSQKAAEFGLENKKTTSELIRKNIEDGILRETFKSVKDGDNWGNFGMHQLSVALAAVALDSQPETDEMFRWLGGESLPTVEKITDPIYGREFETYTANSGGELLVKYVNDVDRNGFGNEVGIGYNRLWVTNSLELAEVLYRYGARGDMNLFENPKYAKMFDAIIRETVGAGYSLHIGDSGSTANGQITNMANETLRAYNMLRDPRLAQIYHYYTGGKLEDVYIDIFTNNDGLKSDIQAVIDSRGSMKRESENLTGFGLAVTREKSAYGDVWMYYGLTNTSHAHRDALQLGINAYGFNFSPDLGYPEATGFNPNRWQWVMNTIAHNAVSVNDEYQNETTGGTPLHFEDAGRIKLMDACADVYDASSIYRRTAISVAVSDEVSYTVDFFRVKGGSSHTYSFHTQSYMGYSTDDLKLVPQKNKKGEYVGTYAGADVPYGPDPNTETDNANYTTKYPRGYTWLTNVNRADNLESGNFSVNFRQTDFNSTTDAKDLNLKFTALNDWTPDSVGIATGYAPRTSSNKNIPGLDYMLIHRKGNDLDTLFTSVLQPYKLDEYIAEVASAPIKLKDGSPADSTAKAVKVMLKNGRVDYIVYSADRNATYTVDELFDFRGFAGVYTLNKYGENVYAYVCDGDIIGRHRGVPRFTGNVVSFTKELTKENSIDVKLDSSANPALLEGKYVYIKNSSDKNGVYKILSAEQTGETSRRLNLGDTTLISGYRNSRDISAGFVYNIAEGDRLEILLGSVWDAGNQPMTRASFVQRVMHEFEIESEGSSSFSDVSEDAYYAAALSAAKHAGIVNGIGDGKFGPDEFITRQDAALILYRAAKYSGGIFRALGGKSLSDSSEISSYAAEAVATLISCKIIQGKAGGIFSPTDFLTGDEADTLIGRTAMYAFGAF